MSQSRFGPPPTAADTKKNIETSPTDDKARFVNFRTSNEKFKEIKKAALDLDMTLGDYLLHAHETLQKSKR